MDDEQSYTATQGFIPASDRRSSVARQPLVPGPPLWAELDQQAARIAALEAALRAVLDADPLAANVTSDDVGYVECRHCDGDEDSMNSLFLHDGDCPWRRAWALLTQP